MQRTGRRITASPHHRIASPASIPNRFKRFGIQVDASVCCPVHSRGFQSWTHNAMAVGAPSSGLAQMDGLYRTVE